MFAECSYLLRQDREVPEPCGKPCIMKVMYDNPRFGPKEVPVCKKHLHLLLWVLLNKKGVQLDVVQVALCQSYEDIPLPTG